MTINNEDSIKITSVLIPLFNHEDFIVFCLNSLLKSNTKKIQLVISDDCSSDNSYSIAKKWIFSHKYLFYSARIFRQKTNIGINKNINFLKNNAVGDFLLILSSDDALSPLSIDYQSTYLCDHMHIDFLFSNRSIMNFSGKIISHGCLGFKRLILLRSNFFIKLDVIYNWGMPWSGVFARRNSFASLGVIPTNLSFDDRWISLKILQTNRYSFLNKSLYIYRMRDDKSTTPGLDKRQMNKDLKLTELRILKTSKGFLYILLFLYTLPYRKDIKNSSFYWLFKLPNKIIKYLYRFISL